MARLGLRACGAGSAVAFVYITMLSSRQDYLGHFAAGLGATLLVLAFPLAVPRARFGWTKLGLTLACIAAGLWLESTVYRYAILDPVDAGNQTLGACIACGAAMERRGGPLTALTAVLLGLGALWLGFDRAFA